MYVHTPCMCLVPTEESKGSLELELLTVVSHCEGTGIKPESSTRARMPLFFFFFKIFNFNYTCMCVNMYLPVQVSAEMSVSYKLPDMDTET